MDIRYVTAEAIHEAMVSAIGEIFCQPSGESITLLRAALNRETDPLARDMLTSILENAELATREGVPTCQDTGLVVVFAQMGNQVQIISTTEDGETGLGTKTLKGVLESAAEAAWKKYYLRPSICIDPLLSRNRQHDRLSQVVLHLEEVVGDELTLYVALKGGGAENCSACRMLNPTASVQEVEDFIVSTVVNAGGKPCPPLFVGVGIGGNFETAPLLAKQALFIPESERTIEPAYREMEQRLLERINSEGCGVMGMSGKTTALKVSIIAAPCHIASLPVAVNLDCHAHRVNKRVV